MNHYITRFFPEPWTPSFKLGLWMFESNYSLNFFGLWIRLPIYPKRDPDCGCESWGVSYFEKGLQFRWGSKCKIVWMPWDYGSCYINQVLNEDNIFVDQSDEYKKPYSDRRKFFNQPFTYTLKNGTVQKRNAEFYVSRKVWKWRIFRKIPFDFWTNNEEISIWVNFDGEVGEGTGSWKGGTIGCGYKMNRNETPIECFRRMERERIFK